jgi:Polyketide cyclase / dehydrase and lipid transport
MFKKIILVLVVLVAIVLAYAATRPDTFQVERTVSIKAPPEKIFPYINDLHSWRAWSPYENLDPALKRTYSGPSSGPGAVYEWEGNSKAGKGRTEIVQSSPPSMMDMKLDMIKPIEGHNVVVFTLKPTGDSTNVTWAMSGRSPYVAKIFGIFFNMDKVIGSEFETGLANLKALAEKS